MDLDGKILLGVDEFDEKRKAGATVILARSMAKQSIRITRYELVKRLAGVLAPRDGGVVTRQDRFADRVGVTEINSEMRKAFPAPRLGIETGLYQKWLRYRFHVHIN
jgi:hypothetical protein